MLQDYYGDYWKLDLGADGVLVCTANRPDAKNALLPYCLQEFARLADDIAEDDRVRAVILTGAGAAFGTGGDLRGFIGDAPIKAAAAGERYHRTWHRIIDMPQPMIVAINGVCAGGSLTLALCGDVLLCADHARLGDPHVPLGLVASGGNCMWPTAVNLIRAKEWLLTGELMSAEEAYRIGLVNHIYPAAELMDRAFTLARKLAKQPPEALRYNKRVLNRITADYLNRMHDAGLAYEALSADTEGHKEAVRNRLEQIAQKKAKPRS